MSTHPARHAGGGEDSTAAEVAEYKTLQEGLKPFKLDHFLPVSELVEAQTEEGKVFLRKMKRSLNFWKLGMLVDTN